MKAMSIAALAGALLATTSIAHASDVQAPVFTDGSKVHRDIDLTVRPDLVIGGLGTLDLEGVRIEAGTKHINVVLPSQVKNAVEFSQSNSGDVSAFGDVDTNGVVDMEASSTAIANTVNLELVGNSAIEGSQFNGGSVTAVLDTRQLHAENVDVSATAIGNTINATVEGNALFDTVQASAGHTTISASLDAEIMGRRTADSEINTAATAIANTLNIEFDKFAIGSAVQENHSDVIASNTSNIDVWRDPATATAIGNAINIVRSATD